MLKSFKKIYRAALAFVGCLAVTAIAAPNPAATARIQEILSVQRAETPGLMAQDGVLGTAIGEDDAGEIALMVFVNSEGKNPGEVIRQLPKAIKGVKVAGHLTDPFRSLGKPGSAGGGGGSGVSHTSKQIPPIKLGTSGGWGSDLANGFCCGGTLGSLISIAGEQFILSNYHVLEADIVPGGNNLVAETGTSVIQPGLIDVNCNWVNAQSVATLVVSNALPNSNVDAAIARATPGMVDSTGAILEIGIVSSETIPAYLNQLVKKSGRTTGLTRSKVVGLNATVSVSYENECAGGPAFTKTFSGQVVINNRIKGKQFLGGGDSGSLLVEDVSTNPKAVGLLFAGSSTYSLANPIGEVLAFFGASMVGQ